MEEVVGQRLDTCVPSEIDFLKVGTVVEEVDRAPTERDPSETVTMVKEVVGQGL